MDHNAVPGRKNPNGRIFYCHGQTDFRRDSVDVGMTIAQVERLLGKPDKAREMHGGRVRYTYFTTFEYRELLVRFDNGVVIGY